MAMNGLAAATATATAAVLLLVMAVIPAATAVTYTVGDTAGWTSGVDYTVWLTGKTFRVGDVLEFTYGSSHSVNEVNKAGYDSCGGTPIDTRSGGNTKIELKTAGTRYFLCPTFGHCAGGMKLAIPILAASPSTPTPTTPTPTTPSTPDAPSDDKTPTTPKTDTPATPTPVGGSESSSPPPSRASGAPKGFVSYGLVMISLVLLGVMAV